MDGRAQKTRTVGTELGLWALVQQGFKKPKERIIYIYIEKQTNLIGLLVKIYCTELRTRVSTIYRYIFEITTLQLTLLYDLRIGGINWPYSGTPCSGGDVRRA